MSALTPYWQPWPTDRMIISATISWEEGKDRITHHRILGMLEGLKTIVMIREQQAVRSAQVAALEAARNVLMESENRDDAIEKIGLLIERKEVI